MDGWIALSVRRGGSVTLHDNCWGGEGRGGGGNVLIGILCRFGNAGSRGCSSDAASEESKLALAEDAVWAKTRETLSREAAGAVACWQELTSHAVRDARWREDAGRPTTCRYRIC